MNQDTQTHSNSVARKGKHITFCERQQIERWLREKKSSNTPPSLDPPLLPLKMPSGRLSAANASKADPAPIPGLKQLFQSVSRNDNA